MEGEPPEPAVNERAAPDVKTAPPSVDREARVTDTVWPLASVMLPESLPPTGVPSSTCPPTTTAPKSVAPTMLTPEATTPVWGWARPPPLRVALAKLTPDRETAERVPWTVAPVRDAAKMFPVSTADEREAPARFADVTVADVMKESVTVAEEMFTAATAPAAAVVVVLGVTEGVWDGVLVCDGVVDGVGLGELLPDGVLDGVELRLTPAGHAEDVLVPDEVDVEVDVEVAVAVPVEVDVEVAVPVAVEVDVAVAVAVAVEVDVCVGGVGS